MRDHKPRRELKRRLVARVDPKFHEQVSKFAEALKVNIQELVVQALVTEMQGFDLRVQWQKLRNQFEALQKTKSDIVAERNRLRKALKEIASQLGVPDTAGHCIQRIGEIEGELQMTADTLSVVEGDRDAETGSKNTYKKSRDQFKRQYEESQAALRVVEAKLVAYQTQGFWGRVLGRVPGVELYVEPQE